MKCSEQVGELAAALSAAQSKIEGAKRDSANPFFKSTYADLASVWAACREQLTANGLSVVQLPYTAENGAIGVQTVLLHSSGQWIEASVSALSKDNSPQATGSVITYLRRYALAAIAGVPQVDDDAEAAEGRAEGKPVTAHKPVTTAKPAAPPAPAASSTGIVTVVNVGEKAGTNTKGEPYTRFSIEFSDGRKASTFKVDLGQTAKSFKDRGQSCEAVIVDQKGYPTLMELNAVVDAAPISEDVPF